MKTLSIFSIIVLVSLDVSVASAKQWGSKITPSLEKFCKDAGGKAKVFPDSCINTCALVKLRAKERAEGRSVRCLPALTADCDCGPQKCLEMDKCIPFHNKIDK